MEDPRPRKKMLAGRQRIYGPDTVFSLPETEDVEDSKPRPMMLAAGQISGSARERICGPDRGFWLPDREFVAQTEDSGCYPEAQGKKIREPVVNKVPSRSLRTP